MGFNINVTRLLLKLSSDGFEFGDVLTLGRQRMNLTSSDLRKTLNAFGYKVDARELKRRNKGYCEPFLQLLGAARVDSMDVSNYENATVLHDLNEPLGDLPRQRYQTLIDSGTLEHVFNFPVAIRNCMELLRQGGNYVGITPCNNFFGHGFYQFSPELYYRVFSKENGFRVTHMYFFIDDPDTSMFSVKDPADVRERVILSNAFPSYLFVVAERTSIQPIFGTVPQQSDYEHIFWKKEKISRKWEKFVPKPLRKLPKPLQKIVDSCLIVARQTGTGDNRFFKKIF